VDAVAAGVRADQHEAVSGSLRAGAHQAIDADEPDTHRIDQRVLRVTLVEVDLAAHSRYADAVPVACDAGHDAVEVMA